MPLKPVYRFDLICDDKVSAACRVRAHQGGPTGVYAVITAYNLKHAHRLVQGQGWRVNDGRRGGQTTYTCPDCVAFKTKAGDAKAATRKKPRR